MSLIANRAPDDFDPIEDDPQANDEEYARISAQREREFVDDVKSGVYRRHVTQMFAALDAAMKR